MRLRAKTDRNHVEIMEALRSCGMSVLSLHQVGKGCPDILVSRAGETFLIEIKDGKRMGWKLTPAQKKFRQEWNAPVNTLDSVEAVIAWVNELRRRDTFSGTR